jgi:hypothetical protein
MALTVSSTQSKAAWLGGPALVRCELWDCRWQKPGGRRHHDDREYSDQDGCRRHSVPVVAMVAPEWVLSSGDSAMIFPP